MNNLANKADRSSLELRWVQGITSKNLSFVNNQTICFSSGNFVIFIDIKTKQRSVLQCPSGSIGAFAASSSAEVIAFSGQRLQPSIYVHTFPGLETRELLKGGAKLDYSLIAFSHTGPYLASYSSIPDYALSLWNWQEGILLSTKSEADLPATHLEFNPLNWYQLYLSSHEFLSVWHVERCNAVYQLRATLVKLPYQDGTMVEAVEMPVDSSTGSTHASPDGPSLPVAAIAGIIGDLAETFIPRSNMKASVHPGYQCWSSTSALLVGCLEGHILRINLDPHKVTILYKMEPAVRESLADISLEKGKIKAMAIHKETLYTAGQDGILRCFGMKGQDYTVDECWNAGSQIENLAFSPDHHYLSVATDKGSVYTYDLEDPTNVVQILNEYNGDLLSADFLVPGDKYCVTVGSSGMVQVWSVEDGTNISILQLETKATTLACCPVSHCATVGSITGHVYFIDATKVADPRMVHKVLLSHSPVHHLHYDQVGQFLLIATADGNVFILDAKPSNSFQVLGFTEMDGEILNLSTLCDQETLNVQAMALVCPKENKVEEAGTKLQLFTLKPQIFSNPSNFTDPKGMLNNKVIAKHSFELDQSLSSAVLGSTPNLVFGHCNQSPYIYKYTLPEDKQKGHVRLSPVKSVPGNQLPAGILSMSPDHHWFASAGTDGRLSVHNELDMDTYAQAQCHAYQSGGIQSVNFSLIGHSIVTTGVGDGTLVCLKWNTSGLPSMLAIDDYGNQLLATLSSAILLEDESLRKMSLRSTESETVLETAPEEVAQEDEQIAEKRSSVEVTTEDESYVKLAAESAADVTWLDQKLQEVIKEEREKFSDMRKTLKEGIRMLRNTIQSMMRENESLPDNEKLDQQEFNMDTQEQERLQAESEKEVARVRKEIELENLAKRYLCHVIKRECWDAMNVKGRAVTSFNNVYEVKNYPLKERTQKELDDLQRVLNLKKIEEADLKIRKEIVEIQEKDLTEDEDEVENENKRLPETSSLIGSQSDEYGGDTSELYSQMELYTREQKRNQIILLQNIIYQVKISFNEQFDIVCKQKEIEMVRVKEKNLRIQEIIQQLDLDEIVIEPTLTDNEQPEKALTVEDSEVKVPKYLTLEQKAIEEEEARIEEERRLEAQADNARQRALIDMMNGVLEIKKEDIFRMEIPRPEFMSEPEADWTEEEKRQFKEYEKKAKDLTEEKDKTRKVMEAEMKKHQTFIYDVTTTFDEILTKLFFRKLKSEMVIYQEELKMNSLVFSILNDEELCIREEQLHFQLDKKRKEKAHRADVLQEFREYVESFRENYDYLVADDKLQDRGFKKEFSDVSTQMVDQLYKLYKRRPRVQRMRVQTDGTGAIGEPPGIAKILQDTAAQLQKALDELDAPENMPEGLELNVWQRFCLSRRAKIHSEQEIKQKALTLAEMQAFLQKRGEDEEKMRLEVEKTMMELNVLREDKMKFQLDLSIQFLLKQGQVEVESGDVIPNYSDAVLLHRGVIEDLNSTILALGEQKIHSMIEVKDFRKGIFQLEWEHKKMRMEMEDLRNKIHDIVRLSVTRELQRYLNLPDYDDRIVHQISVLEQTLELQDENHEKNVKRCKEIMNDLERRINQKIQTNQQLDLEMQEMRVEVAERRHIYSAVGVEQLAAKHAQERYQDIVERSKMVELAKAQAQEIAVLRAEVERLRKRTFPALAQMDC